MNKTYKNYGNKSHQTTTNNAQLASIIHLKINRDMLSSISNKIVIFDFHVISNDCEPDGPYNYGVLFYDLRFLKLSGLQILIPDDEDVLWSSDYLINIPSIAVKMP